MKIARNDVLFINTMTGGGWGTCDILTVVTKDGRVFENKHAGYDFHKMNEDVAFLEQVDFDLKCQIDLSAMTTPMPKTIEKTGRYGVGFDAPARVWFYVDSETEKPTCISAEGDDQIAFQHQMIKTNFEKYLDEMSSLIFEQVNARICKKLEEAAKIHPLIPGEISSKEAKALTKAMLVDQGAVTTVHSTDAASSIKHLQQYLAQNN